MAGELLQLLGHLASQNKANRDADSRIVNNMVQTRMANANAKQIRDTEREQKLYDKNLLESTNQKNALIAENTKYKNEIEAFGYDIDEYYDKHDDKGEYIEGWHRNRTTFDEFGFDKPTPGAKSLMDLSLQRLYLFRL